MEGFDIVDEQQVEVKGTKIPFNVYKAVDNDPLGTYNADGIIFISEKVPMRFRKYVALHELVEYRLMKANGKKGKIQVEDNDEEHKTATLEESTAAREDGVLLEYVRFIGGLYDDDALIGTLEKFGLYEEFVKVIG